MPTRKSPSTHKSVVARSIGKVVYSHRRRAGITQEQLAEKADLSKNYIGNIERGEYEISVSTLHQIGKALGLKASQILDDANL